jgi:hypothetical protein
MVRKPEKSYAAATAAGSPQTPIMVSLNSDASSGFLANQSKVS